MQCTWEEYLWNVSGGCFFRLLPSFVMVGITHHLWQISIGSICDWAGMQRAEQAERAQHDSAAWFDLYSLYFAASLVVVSSWHLHLKWQAPVLCSSADNVKRCEDTQSVITVFQEIPSDVILLLFVSPIRDKQHRFGKCFCTGKEDFNTEVNLMQNIQDVKL